MKKITFPTDLGKWESILANRLQFVHHAPLNTISTYHQVEGHKIHEVYSLVPQDDVNTSKSEISTASKDVESARPLADSTHFDPFKERKIDNPTTDCQTLTHLMKSTLGSGIMAMPYAFRASGIVGGVLGGLFMAAICTHTSYILVDCAHKLYVKARKTKMEYADVVETAFATGPEWIRKYAKYARQFVLIWLFCAYFGACVADNLLISTNYGQVIRYYTKYESAVTVNVTSAGNTSVVNATAIAALAEDPVEYCLLREIMSFLLVPLILFIWVPDLKYLVPISTLANFFMATVIGITCYYLVQNPKPMNELLLFRPMKEAPQFFSITLFAMENIGVMMPLENNMKTPKHFLGTCGVLNRGMFTITFVYIGLGALGYMKYGDEVNTIITTNLPVTDVTAQVVKILIATTVLFTFSLQFYVCREMVWTRVEKYFPKIPLLAEYTIRALLVIACVLIAIALPMIGPIVTLVGAFGFSLLGIICPSAIELIVYWDIGYGRYKWKIFKNVFFIVFGICSLIFGTQYAINEIKTDLIK